jgi:hypothetical protein
MDVLGEAEKTYLEGKGLSYEATLEANMVCLVIKDYGLPAGYSPQSVDLLLRLPPQFPEVGPDMFWTDPAVRYADGSIPQATDLLETYVSRSWQRWSRHFGQSLWRPGVDDLRSYLRLIRSTLEREQTARVS